MKRRIPEDRLALLGHGGRKGLSETEAVALRARFGTNAIAEQPPRSFAALVRDAAGDPMIWFLLLTSGLFGLIGEYTDMAVLLAAILPLIGMDFYLHRRTQASIEGLSSVLAAQATVLRDGVERELPASALVPGDLALVRAGMAFPADGILIGGEELQAEESSLTGEAYPVAKRVYDLASGAATMLEPAESNWAFAGTRLLTGAAEVRILFTGSDTLYGEIVQSAVTGPQGRTPLQAAVARLVRLLLLVALGICALLASVRLWQGFGLVDAFLSAATLAVAAIPEEFPVVLTFFLGVGVYRLARRHALVRRAVAVENIGRVSAICSDKTGTITEGRLTFHDAFPAPGVDRDWLLRVAALASRSDSGDPLDSAILGTAEPLPAGWRRLRLFPFTEGRRRETSLWLGEGGDPLVAMKGAAETVLLHCALEAVEREAWLRRVREMSATGQKVIGCAWRAQDSGSQDEPDADFRFAGLIGIADPIRAGVREAVETARAAGIQVVMVTGDHPETAATIAREAGIAEQPMVVSGDDLAARLGEMDDAQLRTLSVVARASPAQKVLLVEALKRGGRIVAVTGDGVNDVPALRAADIGVAMGLRGTRSAREVSAIVLMDDNFRTIISAIAEGRQLFRNLRLSFAFLLMIHIPLVATAALIPFLGYPLLYLPIHIVWLELLIHPAAILGFQQAAGDHAGLGSDRAGASFFGRTDWVAITATGLIVTAAITLLFIYTVQGGETPEHARSMALVALTVALASILGLLTRLRGYAPAAVAGGAIASALLFTQLPAITDWVHMHPLSLSDWMTAAAIGAASTIISFFFGRTGRPGLKLAKSRLDEPTSGAARPC